MMHITKFLRPEDPDPQADVDLREEYAPTPSTPNPITSSGYVYLTADLPATRDSSGSSTAAAAHLLSYRLIRTHYITPPVDTAGAVSGHSAAVSRIPRILHLIVPIGFRLTYQVDSAILIQTPVATRVRPRQGQGQNPVDQLDVEWFGGAAGGLNSNVNRRHRDTRSRTYCGSTEPNSNFTPKDGFLDEAVDQGGGLARRAGWWRVQGMRWSTRRTGKVAAYWMRWKNKSTFVS